MKVLHLISGGDSGGAKTHVFSLMDKLTKKADVTVVCLMQGVFYQEILERDVRVLLFEQRTRFDLSVCGKLLKLIADEGFDIVHAHGARANFIAAFLIDRTSVPVVTSIHSDYMLDFDSFVKRLVFTNLNRLSLRQIRYFIAVSDPFRQMLIRRGFQPNNIFTVYNGMDFTRPVSLTDRTAFLQQYGLADLPQDALLVGMATRFDKVKGVDVLIRAARSVCDRIPNAHFLIAGDGEDRPLLESLIRELGLSDRVHLLGFVSEMDTFYDLIDVNMLTSHSESFPYALLEGARMKKATVASAVGGIPRLILDGETGYLFPDNDSSACADQICRLLQEEGATARFGQALYDYASSNFSDENLAETHMQIYRSILKKESKKYPYDLVLSGYYGYNNSGDDALLTALLNGLKKEAPDLDVVVLSARPQDTRERFGIDAQNRFSPVSVYRSLKNSRMLVNGGGNLIQDITSTQSLWYYLAVIRLAKKLGKKVCMLANGIGPLVHPQNARSAIKVLQEVDLITLRDKESCDYLNEKIPNRQFEWTSDLAFLLEPAKTAKVSDLLPEDPYYVVAVRNWKTARPDFAESLATAFDRIHARHGIVPVLLPMQYKEDRKLSERIAELMETPSVAVDRMLDIDSILSLIHGARMTLGMRLHALIYSAVCKVPFAGLIYDGKVKSFTDDMSATAVLDVADITADKVVAMMEEVLPITPEQQADLSAHTDAFRLRAHENIVRLLEELQ